MLNAISLKPVVISPAVGAAPVERDESNPASASNTRNRTDKPLQRETNDSAESTLSGKADSVQLSEETRELAKLSDRDREVRAHEAAHAAIGGKYAGPPSLTYKKGPDGKSYATSGEVSIDVTPISGDPQATLLKAEIIRAAALAPAQPSAQDLRIASRATLMAAQARSELSDASTLAGEINITDIKGETPEEISSPSTSRTAGQDVGRTSVPAE